MAESLNSQSLPQWLLPPSRPYLLGLPKQRPQLGAKHPSASVCSLPSLWSHAPISVPIPTSSQPGSNWYPVSPSTGMPACPDPSPTLLPPNVSLGHQWFHHPCPRLLLWSSFHHGVSPSAAARNTSCQHPDSSSLLPPLSRSFTCILPSSFLQPGLTVLSASAQMPEGRFSESG